MVANINKTLSISPWAMNLRSASELEMKARRDILQLRPGTHIPGYTGHCPGLRFGFGGTYGDLTHDATFKQTEDEGGKLLNHIYPNQHQLVTRRPPIKEKTNPRKFHIPDPKNDSSAVGELLRGTAVPYDEIYKRGRRKVELNLSPPDGFKSGYTGYVPCLRHQMGISYTSSSAEAMKNFQDIRSKDIRLSQEVQRALANSKYGRQQSAPALIPIADDHQIRDKLEYLKSRKIKDTERHLLEPPVVGYQGHIPRMRPTNLPVGRNYRYAAETGLQNFYESRIK